MSKFSSFVFPGKRQRRYVKFFEGPYLFWQGFSDGPEVSKGVKPTVRRFRVHISAIAEKLNVTLWLYPIHYKSIHDLSGLLVVNRLSTSLGMASLAVERWTLPMRPWWEFRLGGNLKWKKSKGSFTVGIADKAPLLAAVARMCCFFGWFVGFWLLHCPEVRLTIWTRLDFDHKSSIHDIEGAYIILILFKSTF